jgi:hypothetical protein
LSFSLALSLCRLCLRLRICICLSSVLVMPCYIFVCLCLCLCLYLCLLSLSFFVLFVLSLSCLVSPYCLVLPCLSLYRLILPFKWFSSHTSEVFWTLEWQVQLKVPFQHTILPCPACLLLSYLPVLCCLVSCELFCVLSLFAVPFVSSCPSLLAYASSCFVLSCPGLVLFFFFCLWILSF